MSWYRGDGAQFRDLLSFFGRVQHLGLNFAFILRPDTTQGPKLCFSRMNLRSLDFRYCYTSALDSGCPCIASDALSSLSLHLLEPPAAEADVTRAACKAAFARWGSSLQTVTFTRIFPEDNKCIIGRSVTRILICISLTFRTDCLSQYSPSLVDVTLDDLDWIHPNELTDLRALQSPMIAR